MSEFSFTHDFFGPQPIVYAILQAPLLAVEAAQGALLHDCIDATGALIMVSTLQDAQVLCPLPGFARTPLGL